MSKRAELQRRATSRRDAAQSEIARLLGDQAQVISRAQAVAAGWIHSDLERALRRREWRRVHPGVFVAHTGELDWLQRAWAAVLVTAPSVLAGTSALRAEEEVSSRSQRHGPGRDDDGPIHVAIDVDRHVVAPPGVVVRRRRHLDERARWSHSPPRLRYPEAVLDLALEAPTELGAIGWVADAVGAGRTSPDQLSTALRRRAARGPRVRLLTDVLADVATGACSVLEQQYLERVVRAHRLPIGVLQAPASLGARPCFRDVDLPEFSLVVELDGRLHERSRRQRAVDLDRDLEAAAHEDRRTVRLGWSQVNGDPCRTASLLAAILARSGWADDPIPCGSTCTLELPAHAA